MPLVTRKTQSATTSFGIVRAERTLYVAPDKVLPGDELTTPTRKQLAELAAKYPKEYGPQAGRVATPPIAPSHDVDPTVFSEAQTTYLTLNSEKAIAFIKGAPDVEALGEYYDAEKRREGGPRKTVLAAFHALNVGDQ